MSLSVCVFCSSAGGLPEAYRSAARDLGAELAARGHRLVYGGGNVGLMGEVARAAHQAGGRVHGVIPRVLVDRDDVEVRHQHDRPAVAAARPAEEEAVGVHARELEALVQEGELPLELGEERVEDVGVDERRVEVVEMQMHIVLVGTVPAAFPDLDGDGAGDHVARGEVLGRRRIALHEFLAG